MILNLDRLGRTAVFVSVLVTAVLLVGAGTGTVAAQDAPSVEFNEKYGGAGDDWVLSVAETSDSGFAIAGATSGGAWLVKTDSNGNVEFNKTYGGDDRDDARSVIETSDGGFALAGLTGGGALLVKTDSNGNVEFNKTYGNGTAESVIETSDGGFAIAGQSVGVGDDDAWLIKTDSNGNVEFNKTYGGGVEDIALSLVEVSDGGFVLAGRTESFASGGEFDKDAWLIKTDSSGSEQFNKTFGGGDHDVANSIVEASDGGFALAGNTRSFGGAGVDDAWLIKTDSDGNEEFNKTYGGGDGNLANSVIETSDDGFALAGSTEASGVRNFDALLVKTDSNGNVQFNQTYGGGNNDGAWSVVETSDSGFALGGDTQSFGARGRDAWLLKLSGSESGNDGGDGQGLPGFTVVATILAILTAAVVAVRRRTE